MNRRHSLALLASSAVPLFGKEEGGVEIATNTYPWRTFAKRAGKDFENHSEKLLARIAAAGIRGYEPILGSVEEMEGLREKLKRHELVMKSCYVNSTLHEQKAVEASQEKVLQIARKAKSLGAKIVVTNPAPIRWGGKEDKSDAQLRLQAEALNELGAALAEAGMTLAYHNHDSELRHGAREFHHMLTATSPEKVKFCLDAHWVFRGCGDSEIAVFDVLEHYHERIVEMHLRQSHKGIWQEVFSVEGDLDFGRIFEQLARAGVAPYLVLEQAVEEGSPKEFSADQAHAKGRGNLVNHLR